MFIRNFPAIIVCFLLITLTGCVVGGRHQIVHTTQTQNGRQAEIEGTATAFEFGIVADFRYFRLALPFEGVVTEITGTAKPTGYFKNKSTSESRALRLDIPLISLYNFEGGGTLQYPGNMPHRHSLELWTGAAATISGNPDWWTDLGITYYKHDAVAVRLYAGYGQISFREMMQSRNTDNQLATTFWEGRAGGIALGLELTLSAGEHALDLLKFIFEEDKRIRDSTKDW